MLLYRIRICVLDYKLQQCLCILSPQKAFGLLHWETNMSLLQPKIWCVYLCFSSFVSSVWPLKVSNIRAYWSLILVFITSIYIFKHLLKVKVTTKGLDFINLVVVANREFPHYHDCNKQVRGNLCLQNQVCYRRWTRVAAWLPASKGREKADIIFVPYDEFHESMDCSQWPFFKRAWFFISFKLQSVIIRFLQTY